MLNYTDMMDKADFDKVAQGIDIDWDAKPGNDTDLLTTTEPPYKPSNLTGDGQIQAPMDIHGTNGFGLHFVGHGFGESQEVQWSLNN